MQIPEPHESEPHIPRTNCHLADQQELYKRSVTKKNIGEFSGEKKKKKSWAKGSFAERGQDGRSIRIRQKKKKRGERKENPLTAPRFQLKRGGSSARTD